MFLCPWFCLQSQICIKEIIFLMAVDMWKILYFQEQCLNFLIKWHFLINLIIKSNVCHRLVIYTEDMGNLVIMSIYFVGVLMTSIIYFSCWPPGFNDWCLQRIWSLAIIIYYLLNFVWNCQLGIQELKTDTWSAGEHYSKRNSVYRLSGSTK